MMSKKDKKQIYTPTPTSIHGTKDPGTWYEQLAALLNHKLYGFIIIAIVSGLFYANTIQNEYALDDVMFITMNSYTKAGTSGIEDIFKHESLTGFIGEGSKSTGGRWRPLSLIMFANEWEIFDSNPHPKHAIHIGLYMLLAISVLLFFRKHIFKNNPVAAFIATLLFVIHPVHTEVMANIKSRDELLSMLFIVLTLHTSLNFIKKRRVYQLVLSLVFYFLALLSKENGIALIAILPLTWFVFTESKLRDMRQLLIGYSRDSISYLLVLAIYFAIRVHYVPFTNYHLDEVMNAPFLYATPVQRICTVIMLLGKYFLLLFWPNPLSYDYSYNQVPYVGLGNIWFIMSFIIYGALVIGALWFIRFKNIIAYGVLFYLLSMFIVSNLVVDTGVVIGERFLFQPSLGWAIALTAAILWLYKKIRLSLPSMATITVGLLSVISVVAFAQTTTRNAQWKADTVLMPHDANVSPNSARACNGGGSQLIIVADMIKDTTTAPKAKLYKDSLLHLGLRLMKRALVIHPKYVDPLLNIGVAYTRLNKYDSAEYYWNRADSQYKVNFFTDIAQRHPFPIKIYNAKKSIVVNNLSEGVPAFLKFIDDYNVPIKFISANKRSDSAETYKETHPKIKYEFYPLLSDHYMTEANILGSVKKDYDGSRHAFKQAMHFATGANAELYYNVGGFYYTIGKLDSAQMAWLICLKMDPKHEKAKQGLAAIMSSGMVHNAPGNATSNVPPSKPAIHRSTQF